MSNYEHMILFRAGLLFTYLGMYLMNGHGQPALLYLVPCTLGMMNLNYLFVSSLLFSFLFARELQAFLQISGTCVVLGLARGELRKLWHQGADNDVQEESDSRGEA